jgi:hypothetical protein
MASDEKRWAQLITTPTKPDSVPSWIRGLVTADRNLKSRENMVRGAVSEIAVEAAKAVIAEVDREATLPKPEALELAIQ